MCVHCTILSTFLYLKTVITKCFVERKVYSILHPFSLPHLPSNPYILLSQISNVNSFMEYSSQVSLYIYKQNQIYIIFLLFTKKKVYYRFYSVFCFFLLTFIGKLTINSIARASPF